MKEDKRNGCGVYPLVARGWPKYACEWHDKAYSKDSWAQKSLTRKQTDEWFLRQLLEVSGSNPAKKTASYVMYGIVRVLGWAFWENEVKK